MGRGNNRIKVVKQNIDQQGMSDMFNQLLGDEKSLDINIIRDKYMKLKTNIERIYRLLESFHNTIYVKVINTIFVPCNSKGSSTVIIFGWGKVCNI